MNSNEIRDALIAGGVPPEQLMTGTTDVPKQFSAILDPVTAEPLMVMLAEVLRPYRPSRIAVWDDADNSVLAYTVARQLGVAAVRIVDASGILDYDGDLIEGDRVAIIADAFRTERALVAADRLVDTRGGQIVAAAALMSTPFLAALGSAVPAEGLWRPEEVAHR